MNKNKFAYDLSNDIVNQGEIWDIDVINQSIEMIIGTSYGERIFNIGFGSPLSLSLFENMNNSQAEKMLDGVISAIKTWEDRITILENDVRLITQDNGYILRIPYIINKSNLKSIFQKKIVV